MLDHGVLKRMQAVDVKRLQGVCLEANFYSLLLLLFGSFHFGFTWRQKL